MSDAATVRKLALAMPDVGEKLSYGTPAFYVRRKLFARLLPDDDSVVVKIDSDDRERRMKANPSAYYITDHYRNYPMMIVRLSQVETDDLTELLNEAWQHAQR